MSDLRATIIQVFDEILDEDELTPPDWQDSTILLDTGMDSLGFAVAVSRLEIAVGYDPFSLMTEAVYPTTLGQFVEIYSMNSPK